jgi:small-conductance mechanosensitive channel
MKYLLIVILVFSANILNAQSLDAPDKEIKYQQLDPLQSALLKVDNPCNDERYLELKEIPLDEMTDRQFKVYQQKDKACQDYLNTVEDNKAEQQTADSTNDYFDAIKVYYYIAGAGLLISLIYLLTI